jgi:Na+/alanine symporter
LFDAVRRPVVDGHDAISGLLDQVLQVGGRRLYESFEAGLGMVEVVGAGEHDDEEPVREFKIFQDKIFITRLLIIFCKHISILISFINGK